MQFIQLGPVLFIKWHSPLADFYLKEKKEKTFSFYINFFLLHIFQLLDGTTRFLVSLDYLPNASQTSVHRNLGNFVKEQLIHEIEVDLRFCIFTKFSGDDDAVVPRTALGVAQLLNI